MASPPGPLREFLGLCCVAQHKSPAPRLGPDRREPKADQTSVLVDLHFITSLKRSRSISHHGPQAIDTLSVGGQSIFNIFRARSHIGIIVISHSPILPPVFVSAAAANDDGRLQQCLCRLVAFLMAAFLPATLSSHWHFDRCDQADTSVSGNA